MIALPLSPRAAGLVVIALTMLTIAITTTACSPDWRQGERPQRLQAGATAAASRQGPSVSNDPSEAETDAHHAAATVTAEFEEHWLPGLPIPSVTPGGPTPTCGLPIMIMSTGHRFGFTITTAYRMADVVAEVRVATIGAGRLRESREEPGGASDTRPQGVYRPVVLAVASVLKGPEDEATGYVSMLQGGSTGCVIHTDSPSMELEEGETGLAFLSLADGSDALAELSPTHPTNDYLEEVASSRSSPGERYEVASFWEFYRYTDGLAVNALNGAEMPIEELLSQLEALGGSD